MAYSTYTAEPKLYSVESRGISVFNASPEVDLRIVDLSGIPVRVKIDSKLSYIYLKTGSKTPKEIKDEFLEKYLPLFESMMKHFFKDDSYIYGVYKKKRFFIYDIYTNDNWFTFYDLIRIKNGYKYGDLGFELLPSLVENTRFNTLDVLKIFASEIEKYPEKQKKLYLLPYYATVSATGYSFMPEVSISSLESGNTEEKVFGTYVAPATTPSVFTPEKKKENVKGEENKQEELFDLCELTELSKEERKKIFDDSCNNINQYCIRQNYIFDEAEKSAMVAVSYLWGIWSHLNMRSKIVEYLSQKENYVFLRELNMHTPKNYSYIMLSIWYKYNRENIMRLGVKARKALTSQFISKILKEEFSYFDYVFESILKDTLVKVNAA